MNDWLTRFILFFIPQRSAGNAAPDGKRSLCNLSAADGPDPSTDDGSKAPGLPPIKVDRLAAQLDKSTHALQQACRNVESEFLNMGEQLQDIYTKADRMTQIAQAAAENLGGDANHSTLATITQTAYQALTEFALEQDRMAERVQNIGAICEYLHKLHNLAGGLGRIAKALKMVAININIESCRNAESRDSFSVLSQEIRSLSNTVASMAQTLRDEIQATTDKLETAQQVMDADLSHFARLAEDALQAANRAAPECQVLMDRSVKVLRQVGANGAAISRSTGQIVVSLQIHDNVSQRVAHIAEALADARQLLIALDPDSQKKQACLESVAAVDAIIDLQQAQIADIVGNIDEVFQNSSQAFHTIGDTVGDITGGILQIARGDGTAGSIAGSEAGSIGSLKTALENIRDLIGQGDQAVDKLKAIGSDATAAVSRIGDHMEQVRKVNFDIHLKSLNAIFKSVQLGDRGRSIGVLVQEMKELAIHSNDLVEQIESINRSIMLQADRLQDHLMAAGEDGQNSETVSAELLETSIQEFFESSSDFSGHADEMAHLSHTIDAKIVAAADRLAFLRPFSEQLRSHQDRLIACRAELAPWVAAGGASALDRARLAERYTMDQERNIHSTILDGGKHNAPASQEKGSVSDESEFGDNVELF